ncbi:hypothetical protein KQI42_10610 [Tissierella sp. MSJ-40]|uniref:ABC-2 family transporter protein n=1 Tax=Tissierella simiarum TaxID=2841534 RepID=A0ABS6E6A8_9FIRM|nr:hypothetical protein [Tissierella simiarum]MBU5438463.1 hypothetical protein [Tissierella simiarum]
MIDYLKYNTKILFSPIKWLLCALFMAIIPIAFYCPTLLDFMNLSEIYMPFVGIVMVSDIMLVDKYSYTSEILFLTRENKTKILLVRFLFVGFLLMLFMIIPFLLVYLGFTPYGNIYEGYLFSYWEFLWIGFTGTIFLGVFSMTVANLFSIVQAGYIVSLMYWVYWNINMRRSSIFNIFSFSNRHDYDRSKIFLLGFMIVLMVLNGWIVNRSPLERRQICFLKRVLLKKTT